MYLNEWIVYVSRFFDDLVGASFYFFEPYRRYKNPSGTPSAAALNVRWVGNFANIALYLENGTK